MYKVISDLFHRIQRSVVKADLTERETIKDRWLHHLTTDKIQKSRNGTSADVKILLGIILHILES